MVFMREPGKRSPPAVTGCQGTTTVTITSITINTTSIAIIITSPFHVVNALTLDHCCSLTRLVAALLAYDNMNHFFTHHIVMKTAS